MRDVVLNTWVLIGVAIAWFAVSLAYAVFSGQPQWVGRSGSVITVLGVLLTIKNSVLSASRNVHDVVLEKNHYANWAPQPDSPEYAVATAKARRILRDEYLGLCLTVVGT